MTESASKTPSAKSKSKRRALLLALLLLVSLPVLLFGAIVGPGPSTEPRTVVIPHGASVHEIASLLKQNGVVTSRYLFRFAAKAFTYDVLQAGEYQFTPRESLSDIALQMHDGKSIVHMFTVTEGMTSAETFRLLKADAVLTGDLPAPPPEGSLLPETYRYSYGDSRAGMIARMQKAMQETLNDLWAKRDMTVLLKSPEEAVTMASIVEKETGKPAERARIAEVFYNRLRHNMRLQSDPTVIYAITRAKGMLDHDLDHDDLAFPSPFNTYASDGLPPEPICNPGRAALEAALHPEANDYLYFVADGTGGHVFARDLNEHNQNVTKWLKIKPKP
jgi:UPF0755 protein